MYPRNGGHPRHFLANIMVYASHSHINDCLFQSNIVLTIRKQIIASKKGTFDPPDPQTERQEGRLLPPAPLSGVPANTVNFPYQVGEDSHARNDLRNIYFKNSDLHIPLLRISSGKTALPTGQYAVGIAS